MDQILLKKSQRKNCFSNFGTHGRRRTKDESKKYTTAALVRFQTKSKNLKCLYKNRVHKLKLMQFYYKENLLGTTSKPNRRLTGGSVRFGPVPIVLNNGNRTEPPVNRRLGFEAAPYCFNHGIHYYKT